LCRTAERGKNQSTLLSGVKKSETSGTLTCRGQESRSDPCSAPPGSEVLGLAAKRDYTTTGPSKAALNSGAAFPSWASALSMNSPVSASTMAMVCCFACRSQLYILFASPRFGRSVCVGTGSGFGRRPTSLCPQLHDQFVGTICFCLSIACATEEVFGILANLISALHRVNPLSPKVTSKNPKLLLA
jgi:hypothetical protein